MVCVKNIPFNNVKHLLQKLSGRKPLRLTPFMCERKQIIIFYRTITQSRKQENFKTD